MDRLLGSDFMWIEQVGSGCVGGLGEWIDYFVVDRFLWIGIDYWIACPQTALLFDIFQINLQERPSASQRAVSSTP